MECRTVLKAKQHLFTVSHNFNFNFFRIILASLPSFWEKLSKLVENLTKFWQKELCTVFWDTV